MGSSSGKALLGQEEEPMCDWDSLSHVRWDCKFQMVIVPKYHEKALYEEEPDGVWVNDRRSPIGISPGKRPL